MRRALAAWPRLPCDPAVAARRGRRPWTPAARLEPADLARPAGPGALRRGGADLLERGPPPARPRGAAARPGPDRGPRPTTPRNMARLRTHSHVLPVRGQADLSQRMHRQSLEFRKAAENIAMDKVYRLLGRPISMAHQGCSFTYGDTSEPVPIHTYASLAQEVVARWLASPKHRASLLSPGFQRLGAGIGRRPERPGLRRLLPGAELRRLSLVAPPRPGCRSGRTGGARSRRCASSAATSSGGPSGCGSRSRRRSRCAPGPRASARRASRRGNAGSALFITSELPSQA